MLKTIDYFLTDNTSVCLNRAHPITVHGPKTAQASSSHNHVSNSEEKLETSLQPDTFSFFEVHVACSDDICPQLYVFIRKAMFAGLQEAASTLGYNNSHPNLAFLCSCPREDLHLAVKEGSYWICTMDQERQTCLTLGNKHKMWLTTSEPPTG